MKQYAVNERVCSLLQTGEGEVGELRDTAACPVVSPFQKLILKKE